MQQHFSVFLSYNREDGAAVTRIAQSLRVHGINPWLDVQELPPGMTWEKVAERAIQESRATAFFVGPRGLGQWQEFEVRLAMQRHVESNLPLIPVLLPGCNNPDQVIPGFLRSYTWVDFRDGGLDDELAIRRLRWGITGQRPAEQGPGAPVPPPPPPREDRGEVEETVSNLASFLRSGNITLFLGPGSSLCEDGQASSACEIARQLLVELRVIPEDYDKLLPPLDIAGMYYSVRRGDDNLENTVIDMLAGADFVPQTHKHAASLLNVLRDRKPRRVRQRAQQLQQLVVTTNLDVMAERALLAAGIPFTRIVQHRSAQRLTINEYRDVRLVSDPGGNGGPPLIEAPAPGGGTQRIAPDDYEALDNFIASHGQRVVEQSRADGDPRNPLDELPVHEMTGPILYKHLGSLDVPNSCVISFDHFFTFARRTLRRNCIPAKISEIIGTSAVLFLGYSFLDPDFRFTYYTLVRRPFDSDMDYRYAVQLPPERFVGDIYRQMERGLWDQLKRVGLKRLKITTVEERSQDFLAMLLEAVRRELAT